MSPRGKQTAFLDTHVVVLVWTGKVTHLGKTARRYLEEATLFVSPMVRFELTILRERGRIEPSPGRLLGDLAQEIGLAEARDPFSAVVEVATQLTWARDPFDRLLVAHALLHDAVFVTRDHVVHEHFASAVW